VITTSISEILSFKKKTKKNKINSDNPGKQIGVETIFTEIQTISINSTKKRQELNVNLK